MFSLNLVNAEKLLIKLGWPLNKVEDIRLMADYLGKGINLDKADWSLHRLRRSYWFFGYFGAIIRADLG